MDDERVALFLRGESVADVLDTGAAFGERDMSVLDDGGCALRMEGFVFGGREERCPVVTFDGVGDAEFLTEPEQSLGLGDVEVVDEEDHAGLLYEC